MPSFFKQIVVFAVVSASCLPLRAQSSLQQILQPAKPASNSAPAPADPFGRGTPYGTVFGFLQAAQSGDYSIAAQYLQMSAARRQSEGDQMAMKLKLVMDVAFAGSLKHVSTLPEGTPQEDIPLDHQRIGTMSSGDIEANLDLVRVTDPSAGKIWLISSDTLAKIPELYDQVKARRVETKLPQWLVKHQLAGMPLWQWLALLLAIPVAGGAGWLFLLVLQIPLRWWARHRGQPGIANWRSVSGPGWLLTATVAHRILAGYLGMPLLPRHYYVQLVTVALIIGANWILWQFVRWFLRRVRNRAFAHGHGGTGSLILLGERIIKAVVFMMALFFILGSLGFNMSTALAGLGIVGLAIGFGAQKSIENLFGGVFVLGDEVIRVGDTCRFGDRTGTVEDIGLRSTRVRTDNRTLLAIPNGTVATINVENFSRRDKIFFQTNLALRYETSPDQMRYLLANARRLLYSHPKIEAASVHVRLTDFRVSAFNVEVSAYVLTQDDNEFGAVREDLLLRFIDLINESGTAFALPSQTLYLGRDSGLEKEKTETATKEVTEWRDGKQLPFPDFTNDQISAFRGSLEYPPPDSAQRNPKPGTGGGG